jgi:hypothetical protein
MPRRGGKRNARVVVAPRDLGERPRLRPPRAGVEPTGAIWAGKAWS